jgi:hypothetical protein
MSDEGVTRRAVVTGAAAAAPAMIVHSLGHASISNTLTPEQEEAKYRSLGPIAERHGRFPKGTVLPETTVQACPRVRVRDLPRDFLPRKYFEALEHNQKIASCCRHPENHDIEAKKSHRLEQAPDIYILHCGCGRRHFRFCCGQTDPYRPFWDASPAVAPAAA